MELPYNDLILSLVFKYAMLERIPFFFPRMICLPSFLLSLISQLCCFQKHGNQHALTPLSWPTKHPGCCVSLFSIILKSQRALIAVVDAEMQTEVLFHVYGTYL
jgi:hypothetical protein